MAQENDLLQKLYTFYSTRYKGANLETKFNDAVFDLVKTGDIKNSTYVEFCIDNDIEPTVEVKPVVPTPAPVQNTIRRYNDDGCGGGGNYRRSSC